MYRLLGKRYLIVLDDTWNTQIWHDDPSLFFPDNKNKSRIILTTRKAGISSTYVLQMRFLDDNESWKLLRKMVFTSEDQSCHPPQLEKIGRKIAKNCEGLPLAIIEVGKLLDRTERKIETWNNIAENEDPFTIGLDDDTRVSKALSLSDMVLPQHLKPCFRIWECSEKYADIFPEGTNSQRGLCFHNNIVLGFKQVHSLMESVSGAISLLCFGPPHRYPIHVYLRFRLLRLVDALTIRFYEFPHQVLELVELRYLAITYDAEIPPSISGLVNLECIGYGLPDPCKENGFVDGSVTLNNLLTLSGVSAHSCTRGVLERMPNLMKLGIRMIESSPYYSNEAYYVYNASSYLDRLESFKCIAIVNPDPDPNSNPDPDPDLDYSQLAYHPIPYPTFPDNIRKITLSGFGYPWYYMIIMCRLPNLEVLKLRCNAFRGPEWVTPTELWSLKFMLLEDLDIEQWMTHRDMFPHLKCLIIRHCYKLREIPFSSGDIFALEIIEVDDCSPSVVTWVQKLHEELQDSRYESLQLRLKS
ncbi:hypothetical protein DH2020_044508 [Rehmannia glutinosa]|uniref:NB-ARC domain-containing protein n=1 Tax=Rehmannia glutinosa TaxID=99300 RepID=A0ABR0UGQ1_REHGL